MPSEVSRLVVTASGGPFRGRSRAELQSVTVDEALAHPTWSMGAKITIDSSTLMNKGLEVIEAHELFGIDFDRIEVVVHPQSVVHGMVEFCDGATIAQLSMPDMRLPIGLALGAPAAARPAVRSGRLDHARAPSTSRHPTARRSGPSISRTRPAGPEAPRPRCSAAPTRSRSRRSSTGGCPWTGIDEVVAEVLQDGTGGADEVADVLEADRRARERAREVVAQRSAA